MIALSEPECVWDLGAELGEGALWSPPDRAVWFVDIKKRHVHRFDPATGNKRTWDAPEQVSFILPAKDGGWVAGLQSGVHRFDPESGSFTLIARPERHPEGNRLNDGYVDAAGRLWFGTMSDSEQGRTGGLFRLEADGVAREQDGGYRITNGPAMSPDGRTLYHTDTLDRVIYAFDVADDGGLSNRREFVQITREGANPDGHCVDAEGCIWTALFGGWGLERYSPKGELLDYVRLPVPNITKAAFGGEDLQTLYVVTARLHLDEPQRQASPLAGGLFALRVGVSGLPQNAVTQGL